MKGFQLRVSLMLVARATSKHVITDLNHIGVCLSYSQTFRYVEDIARVIDNSRQLQGSSPCMEGNWIVVISISKNLLFMKGMPDTVNLGTSPVDWPLKCPSYFHPSTVPLLAFHNMARVRLFSKCSQVHSSTCIISTSKYSVLGFKYIQVQCNWHPSTL